MLKKFINRFSQKQDVMSEVAEKQASEESSAKMVNPVIGTAEKPKINHSFESFKEVLLVYGEHDVVHYVSEHFEDILSRGYAAFTTSTQKYAILCPPTVECWTVHACYLGDSDSYVITEKRGKLTK